MTTDCPVDRVPPCKGPLGIATHITCLPRMIPRNAVTGILGVVLVTAGLTAPRISSTASIDPGSVLGAVRLDTPENQIIAMLGRPTAVQKPYYGSRVKMDGLGNIVLGGSGQSVRGNVKVSVRFQAGHTGRLLGFHHRMATAPGYGVGNGGTILIQLQTDDGTPNHFPSGTVLASFETPANAARGFFDPTGQGASFKLVSFPSPPSVVSGQLYHIVFSNTAADPVHNYVSVDFIWNNGNSVPAQPTYPDVELAALMNVDGAGWQTASSWWVGEDRSPMMELKYDDGFIEGRLVYNEWWQTNCRISGPSQIRETFTPSVPVAASTIAVRAFRASGSDPLTVRLEIASSGALVASGQVPASSFPTSNKDYYVTVLAPVILDRGTRYNLVLQSPATSVYGAHAVQAGSGIGADPAAYFNDGHAQENPGTGWRDYVPVTWGTPQPNAHLQFYLTPGPTAMGPARVVPGEATQTSAEVHP